MLQNSNTLKVLEPFFLEPTKTHYLLDISRKIGLAHTSVKKELMALVKKGTLIERIERKKTRKFPVYSANLDDAGYKSLKKACNLQKITASGIIEYIADKLAPKCIVLFGSYERGEDIEDSDIDLFVECPSADIPLDKYEHSLKRKIQLHMSKNFSTYPAELKNNIINGTVVHGFLEGY